ncbi:MAG TPA: alpha/beta fold hydrolase, partial [Anaerolineales bacterium]|nr:alpha/beta fold hydrolase [Anaerolineales bacterium]
MTTKFFKQKNGQIAYDITGEGQLVICVPSLGDVRDEYRFLVPLLVKAGYRVATMDVRGHGETSVEWDDFSVAAIGEDILALV